MSKNPHASALGKLSAGVPKKYSADELQKRKARLAVARSMRWKDKQKKEAKV